MTAKRIIAIQFPPDLLTMVDSTVDDARAHLPAGARVTRHGMLIELIRSGLAQRRAQLQDYSREEARNAQAREQRAAGASV